jgi:hypothetical protein
MVFYFFFGLCAKFLLIGGTEKTPSGIRPSTTAIGAQTSRLVPGLHPIQGGDLF